jgi:hypothetical protein
MPLSAGDKPGPYEILEPLGAGGMGKCIGRVTTVLEGSVRRSGNRIRVTAQLITAADGGHPWSERYDREMADVFAVQDEISAAISGALQVKLSPAARGGGTNSPPKPRPGSEFLWTHYYLAEFYITRQRLGEALAAAEKAFSVAPWYAPSVGIYAGLLILMGHPERWKEVVGTLGSGEAYGTSKGWGIFHIGCGELDRAADWFEKAIEERDFMVAPFLQSAIGKPLRASSRRPKLAALMNLPAAGL